MLDITSASAGSGKTFKLARTYIDLLLSHKGTNLHRRILAVTFTKKATAEMKERIVQELSFLANGEPSRHREYLMDRHKLSEEELQEKARNLLCGILQDYSAFAVSTIDSFFQRIIRSFSRELNLPGSYNLELDSKHILQEAVDGFFFDLSSDPKDPLVKSLHQLVAGSINEDDNVSIKEKVLSLSRELNKEVYKVHRKVLENVFDNQPQAFYRFQKELQTRIDTLLQQMLDVGRDYKNVLADNHLAKEDFIRNGSLFNPFYSSRSDLRKGNAKFTATFRKFAENDAESAVAKTYKGSNKDALIAAARAIQPLARNWIGLYARLTELLLVSDKLPYLSLLSDISAKISEKNAELNRLPIDETNRLLNDVISANEEAPFVYDKIGVRLSHYLIDEFQDTSRMQWDNFRPLLKEALATGQYNLVVGDVKQSIYRFRNSDYNLMLSQLDDDFSAGQITKVNLGDNWRSDVQIVETNNYVFRLLAEAENDEINGLTGASYPALTDKIQNVFATLEQHPQKTGEQGYVRFQFLDSTTRASFREDVLERLPGLLRDIQSRNIPLGRVAVLLRNSKEIREAAQCLTAGGFRVMSNEGLLLTASREVRFLVGLLAMIQSPDDKVQCLNTCYEYALLMGKNADEAIQCAVSGNRIFSEEQQSALQTIAGLPLYDQVQALVTLFGLDKSDSAKPYIQSFLDCVYRYITKYQADLYSFMQWWNEHADKLSVASSDSSGAVQLLTMHKSKGLEYDVVIIPFCDWEKGVPASANKIPLLWLDPKKSTLLPLCPLPVLPVMYSDKMADTSFAEDYYQEKQNAYIDNLNLTYVAFTRAKRELYVYAPVCKKDNTSTMGALLHKVLSENNRLTDNIYERGEKVHNAPMPAAGQVTQTDKRMSEPLNNRLRIKLSSATYLTAEDAMPDFSKPVNLGSVMHNILQQIHRFDDEQPLLLQMQQEGNLTPRDVEILNEELRKFNCLVASTDWFSGEYTDLNEQDILLPDGTTRRPDRILLKDKTAVVIDYKFGNMPRPAYNRQVHDYMSLLSKMGYEPRGYLCYINLKRIEEVPFVQNAVV